MSENCKVFNIYCDESRVENPDSNIMVIGALVIPRRLKSMIVRHIREICSKYSFIGEIKWTKTSSKFIKFYEDLIDYFVSERAMGFRCIIVDKSKIDYPKYHDDDEELAFFKFYYLMLREKLLDNNRYYIFLDKKPTRDRNRARALHAFLDSHILIHKQDCSIEHFQAYSSYENILLQLSDYLTGLVAYDVNTTQNGSVKFQVAKYLRNRLDKRTFLRTSLLSDGKFNVFVWGSKDGEKG